MRNFRVFPMICVGLMLTATASTALATDVKFNPAGLIIVERNQGLFKSSPSVTFTAATLTASGNANFTLQPRGSSGLTPTTISANGPGVEFDYYMNSNDKDAPHGAISVGFTGQLTDGSAKPPTNVTITVPSLLTDAIVNNDFPAYKQYPPVTDPASGYQCQVTVWPKNTNGNSFPEIDLDCMD